MKYVHTIIISFLFLSTSFSQNTKYEKWQTPGYFRGYNVLYESPKTLQDFIDFKNYGGNFLQIGTGGFMAEDSPYGIVQSRIDGTDLLVNYCRQTGIHYTIAVRSGPGAYDTYQESQGNTGESRIWESGNLAERQLYANMLVMIANRYSGDTLFAGLNLVVEPRPKVRYIPANNSTLYKYFLENVYHIYMAEVYQFFINEIRGADTELPIIIENFAYSTPELFPAYKVSDPYIIYDAHLYQPKEYTNANQPFLQRYPGTYWNITYLSQQLFDARFMRETVLGRLRDFQMSANAPVMIGEFGIFLPQYGTSMYLSDVLNICKDYGWHFAMWDWRRGQDMNWNIEGFNSPQYPKSWDIALGKPWEVVLGFFYAPPAPTLRAPADSSVVNSKPVFSWEHITGNTRFDAEVSDGSRVLGRIADTYDTIWTYNGLQLPDGGIYHWKVKAKNPGGHAENESAWSEERIFIVQNGTKTSPILTVPPIGNKFKLGENYPNPFNPVTKIRYQIAKNSFVELKVFDILGKEVEVLVNRQLTAGTYEAVWDASSYPSGIYFYRLMTQGYTETKKMVLTK